LSLDSGLETSKTRNVSLLEEGVAEVDRADQPAQLTFPPPARTVSCARIRSAWRRRPHKIGWRRRVKNGVAEITPAWLLAVFNPLKRSSWTSNM
jgi:hypothetical protein